ncbi:Hypothetical protein, putative [Bodo saltans]|uniref:Uncharacterized protein n=1 Tax=Bodo saltans TaxID=75058 RepID=A0A0S4JME1_BODSA|nr:Hypothetical protein, putative [Bodo saltans]|eukprot:CUG91365.1 Hypothetical protein, putative [Bodo saltans]
MRATFARRYASLMDTVLVGRWVPPSSAAGATEAFRQWRTRTRNRPVVPQQGAHMVRACLQEAEVEAAMNIVFAQDDTAPLLRKLYTSLHAEGGEQPSLTTSEKIVEAMEPMASGLQGRPGQAEFISVLLYYASFVLQERSSSGTVPSATARSSAERAIDNAIRVAQASPSHAAVLLRPIALAAPPSYLGRVVALVDVAFRSKRTYIDVDGLRAILKLVAHRNEFHQSVIMWWRWMQHTQLSLEPMVLSLVIEVLCRAQKPTEASEVVQQLHALGSVPEPHAQLIYLQHLVLISRPPVAQAELLVNLWSQSHANTGDGHIAGLQWALLQFYYATKNSKLIRQVSAALLRDVSTTKEQHLQELLQKIVDDTSAARKRDAEGTAAPEDLVETYAVRVLLERFTPNRAEMICTAALLGSRAGCVELVGPWLESCSDEVFDEALSLVASRSSNLAVELCEVSHRVVPDSLNAWSKLLNDDPPGAL